MTDGLEAQAHIVCNPISRAVAQRARKQLDGTSKDAILGDTIQVARKWAGKGPKPTSHAGRQWRGSRDQLRTYSPKAMSFQQAAEFGRGRVIPGKIGRGCALNHNRGADGGGDRRNIPEASELSDKASSQLKVKRDILEHCMDVSSPVEYGIGKDRIEAPVKLEFVHIGQSNV